MVSEKMGSQAGIPGFGKLTGVGVGPGDPELLTLKAVKVIKESDVIAFPGKTPEESAACRIAQGVIPKLLEKELLPVELPMTRDRGRLVQIHRQAADLLEGSLREGKNIAFLTLGDPSFYSTFSYVAELVRQDGFQTGCVSGVPSFCEAAARLEVPIALGGETVRILPSIPKDEDLNENPDHLIFLKIGKHAGELRDRLKASGYEVRMAENCGMADEKLYRAAEEIPDTAGYFSLMIAKKAGHGTPID